MLDIISPQPNSSTNVTAYRISLQLHRAESSLRNTTRTASHLSFDEYEAVVVTQHRFMSASEAEAVLPYGCWRVMAAFTVVTKALQVALPRSRREFSSDQEYFHFVLERQLTPFSRHSISGIASAVREVLETLQPDDTTQHHIVNNTVRLIGVVIDVVKREGPSRDLMENQQLFRVLSAAWNIHLLHQQVVTSDYETRE